MKRQRYQAPVVAAAASASSSLVAPWRRTDGRGANRPAPPISGQKEHSKNINIATRTSSTAVEGGSSVESFSLLGTALPKRGRRQRSRRLFSATTVGVGFLAAAAVAVVGGVLDGVPMADAVMTEAQCVEATLMGTEEELVASPRDDTATEAVAAGIDRKAVASQVRLLLLYHYRCYNHYAACCCVWSRYFCTSVL